MLLNNSFSEEFCKIASLKDRIESLKEHLLNAKDKVTEVAQDNKDIIKKTLPFAVGGLAALGTYAGMRKFKASKNPALAKLQNSMKGKNLVIQKDQANKADRLLYGNKVVTDPKKVPKNSGVLNYSNSSTAFPAKVQINDGKLIETLDDKFLFDRAMNFRKSKAKITAKKTQILEDMLDTTPDLDSLNKKYPKGYIIKSRKSSMTNPTDLITDIEDPKVEKILSNGIDTHIIQEKLPIKNEFRVHVINGEPFSTTNRRLDSSFLQKAWKKLTHSDGGGAFVPVIGKTKKELNKFVRDAHKDNVIFNAASAENKNFHVAYDVAQLPDNSFRLIEANPTPGTFNNPIIARKFNKLVTGKWGRDVSTLAGLGVGATAGASTYAGLKYKDKKDS